MIRRVQEIEYKTHQLREGMEKIIKQVSNLWYFFDFLINERGNLCMGNGFKFLTLLEQIGIPWCKWLGQALVIHSVRSWWTSTLPIAFHIWQV
jgi:hypothetical protein